MVEFDEFKENILTQFPILRDQEILRYRRVLLNENNGSIYRRGIPFIKVFDDNNELYKVILFALSCYLNR